MRRGFVCPLTVLLAACGAVERLGVPGDAGSSAPAGAPRAAIESAAAARRVDALRRRFTPATITRAEPDALPSARPRPAIDVGAVDRFEPAAEGRLRAVVSEATARAASRRASVQLPVTADASFSLQDDASGLSVRVSLVDAAPSRIEVGGGIALYRGALHGADVLQRVHAEGTEDFVAFEAKPSREQLTYRVDVSRVAGLRLVGNVLELLDAQGDPRLRVSSPYVVDAKGERREATLSVDGCAFDTSSAAPWGREVTPPRATGCDVHVRWSGVAYPALVDPAWVTTGSMQSKRANHTATTLTSGLVLTAGGTDESVTHSTAELFQPTTRTFAMTGSLFRTSMHTATLLSSGRVLIAGGLSSTPASQRAAAEYDPSTGIFTASGPMVSYRYRHAAAVLANGKVLLVGGVSDYSLGTIVSTAELYDPSARTFVASAGSMAYPRVYPSANVLRTAKVLVAGGVRFGTNRRTAELFDPTSGTFAAVTNPMTQERLYHTGTTLDDGKVLLAGGEDSGGIATVVGSSAEVYDPVTGYFAATLLRRSFGTSRHSATLLPSGLVLLAGGLGAQSTRAPVSNSEFYDPASRGFKPNGSMWSIRDRHAAALLPGGAVLVSGGFGASVNSSAELALLPLGATCSSTGQCASGFCADGVCCNTACNAACQVCAPTTGACGTVRDTTDDACTGSSTCDAAGACKTKLGQGCTSGSACLNGFCVDGVCCDTACSDPCVGCTGAVTGSVVRDGTCANVVAGRDPKGSCSAPSCSGSTVTTSTCNGLAACEAATRSCSPFACNAAGNACASSCVVDADCGGAGFYCAAAVCASRKANGAGCGEAKECLSGSCADGVCCAGACGGACESCKESGKEGQCVPVTGAPRAGHAACAGTGACAGACDGVDVTACRFPAASTPCGAGCASGALSACDGAGGCLAPAACAAHLACADATSCKTSCASDGDCSNGYYCEAGTCLAVIADGAPCARDGQCSHGACAGVCCATACGGGYACASDGSACKTSCTSDSDCLASSICSAGACVSRKPIGAACSAASECASGSCADGVCCDTPCAGACQACVASRSGVPGSDGTCKAVVDGRDPDGDCGAASCAGGSLTASVCDGAGACRAANAVCASGCNVTNDGCKVDCASDADCGANGYCGPAKQCVAKLARGKACSASAQCLSGACADGVCCDRACSGQCEACAEAGSEGTCATVSGQPRAPRTACSGAGGECGGACDGKTGVVCAFPGVEATCGGGCKDGSIALCDGAGACRAPTSCPGDLACEGASACKATCAADADCRSGFGCDGGTCVPRPATCSADRSQSIPGGDAGAPQRCDPYKCGATGTCLRACATDDDCSAGYSCDAASGPGACVADAPPPTTGTEGHGGCGASRGGPPSGGALGAVAVAMLGGEWLRRRRAGRPTTGTPRP